MNYLDRTAIHCPTEKEAQQLLSHLATLGFSWASGHSLRAFTHWRDRGQRTVYHVRDGCVTISSTCAEGYRLLDMHHVLKVHYSMNPDELYGDFLVTEDSKVDGLS